MTSTKDEMIDKASEYSKLQYHCTHRPAEAMRQDTVALLLAQKVALNKSNREHEERMQIMQRRREEALLAREGRREGNWWI